jgi:hypothetical protein
MGGESIETGILRFSQLETTIELLQHCRLLPQAKGFVPLDICESAPDEALTNSVEAAAPSPSSYLAG